MAGSKLKVAVLGTNIGCTLHVRALRAAGFDVTALVGRDAERTAARAAHFGIPGAFTEIGPVIDSDADAIVIATPPESHHRFALAVIAAGKHVLCEKPFALDAGQAKEMRDAAIQADIAHMVVHEFRWFAANAMLRRLLRGAELGQPLQAAFLFDHSLCAPAVPDVPDWWRRHDRGGGWLRNYNAHGIDLVRYMVGEFAAVSGYVHRGTDREMTSDDGYSASFILADGTQGVMAGSCRAWDYHALTRIISARGSATLSPSGLTVADAAGSREVMIPPDLIIELAAGGPIAASPGETLPRMDDTLYTATHSSDHGFAEQVGLCSAFRARIRDRSYANPAIADFNDGVAHMEIIEAIERSCAKRCWIDLV